MEQEEYIVDGHKVTHSVHLGDREIFLAVQQDAPLPFYVGYMEVSYELGLARFSGIEGTTEYTEAWEMFIQRLQKQIEQVRAQRQEHHAPQLLTEADCIRDSRAGDYEGKVLVMRPGVLRPEYWNAAHQLRALPVCVQPFPRLHRLDFQLHHRSPPFSFPRVCAARGRRRVSPVSFSLRAVKNSSNRCFSAVFSRW